jgi:hypothetical protein
MYFVRFPGYLYLIYIQCENVHRIHLAQDMVQQQALVNMAVILLRHSLTS